MSFKCRFTKLWHFFLPFWKLCKRLQQELDLLTEYRCSLIFRWCCFGFFLVHSGKVDCCVLFIIILALCFTSSDTTSGQRVNNMSSKRTCNNKKKPCLTTNYSRTSKCNHFSLATATTWSMTDLEFSIAFNLIREATAWYSGLIFVFAVCTTLLGVWEELLESTWIYMYCNLKIVNCNRFSSKSRCFRASPREIPPVVRLSSEATSR